MADVFPTAVYLLCFVTSGACAYLLARNYGRTGARLLMWSALCFALLAATNAVLVVDLVLLTEATLRNLRAVMALAAVSVLLFGFIWDTQE